MDLEHLYEWIDLRKRLVGLRYSRGLSQRAVAAKMGTTQSAVSELETGVSMPQIDTLFRYAEAIGARLGFTIEEEDWDEDQQHGEQAGGPVAGRGVPQARQTAATG